MAAAGRFFVLRDELAKSAGSDRAVVAALLEGDAKDLAGFGRRRFVGRVDLDDRIFAALLGFQDFERGRFVAGSDDAIGDFAGDDSGGGHVDSIGQGDEIAKGGHAVDAARAGVGVGQRREFKVVDKVDFLEQVSQRNGDGRAGRADVLERGRGGQAGSLLQFADKLPGIQRIEQVDVTGRAAEDGDGQIGASFHEDAGRGLLGVGAVAERKG